jgi:hypothetical protein
MKANLVAIPKVEFRGRTRSLEQSSGLPLNVPQERSSATSNNCFRRTTLSHKRLFETATNFVVLLLVVLISLPALAKAPERSVALIFQPARASDAEKVAQLRLLLAKTFRDRGMAIKRFLISFDNGGLERAKAKLKAARGALAKDTNLSHVPETETLLTTARYGFLSVLGEVSIDDLSATLVSRSGVKPSRSVAGVENQKMAYSVPPMPQHRRVHLAGGDEDSGDAQPLNRIVRQAGQVQRKMHRLISAGHD